MVIARLPSRRHVVRPGRRARARPALRAYSMNGASCLRNAAAFLALRSISCSVPPTANRTVSTAGPPVRSSSSTAAPNQISGGSGVHLSILPWPSVPWGLRPAVSAGAAGVLLGVGGLVRRRADHRRRAGRPGGTPFWRGAGAVAAGGGRVLPSRRQDSHQAQPEPARTAPGRRRAPAGSGCAQLAFRLVSSGITIAGTAKPNCMMTHHCA